MGSSASADQAPTLALPARTERPGGAAEPFPGASSSQSEAVSLDRRQAEVRYCMCSAWKSICF